MLRTLPELAPIRMKKMKCTLTFMKKKEHSTAIAKQLYLYMHFIFQTNILT